MRSPPHRGNRNAERHEGERRRDDIESEHKETRPGRDSHHDRKDRPREGMHKAPRAPELHITSILPLSDGI